MKTELTLLAAAAVLTGSTAAAGITGTFVSVVDGVNTFQSVDGVSAFSNTTVTNGLWHDRPGVFDLVSFPAPLSGTYQAQAATSNEVVTTLTGLLPGSEYNIDIIHGIHGGINGGLQDIDAGFVSGALTTILEANSTLTGEALNASPWEAAEQSIGTAFADANGEIKVYVNYAAGAERSIYNGLAYTVIPGTGSAYCFGDGTGISCPCSAFGASGEGCANTGGQGATLVGSGSASMANDTFRLDVSGVPGTKPGLVLRGDNQVSVPAGDGILCTAGGSMRSQVQMTSAGITAYTDFKGAPFGSVANVGAATNFQFWYRDPANPCSGGGFNFTNAWTVTYTP